MKRKTFTVIPASTALAKFAGRNITVQVATPTKEVRDTFHGRREVDAFKVHQAPLALEHILSAKQWNDGAITITTIDGQKHVMGGTPQPPREDEDDE